MSHDDREEKIVSITRRKEELEHAEAEEYRRRLELALDPKNWHSLDNVVAHGFSLICVALLFFVLTLTQVIEFSSSSVFMASGTTATSSNKTFSFKYLLYRNRVEVSTTTNEVDTNYSSFSIDYNRIKSAAANYYSNWTHADSSNMIFPFSTFLDLLFDINNNNNESQVPSFWLTDIQNQQLLYDSLQPILCTARIDKLSQIYNSNQEHGTGITSGCLIMVACLVFMYATANLICTEITFVFSRKLKKTFPLFHPLLDYKWLIDLDEPLYPDISFPDDLDPKEWDEKRLEIREKSKRCFSIEWFLRMGVKIFRVSHAVARERNKILGTYYFGIFAGILGFMTCMIIFGRFESIINTRCSTFWHSYDLLDIPFRTFNNNNDTNSIAIHQSLLSLKKSIDKQISWIQIRWYYFAVTLIFGLVVVLWTSVFLCTRNFRGCCAKEIFRPTCTFVPHTTYAEELFMDHEIKDGASERLAVVVVDQGNDNNNNNKRNNKGDSEMIEEMRQRQQILKDNDEQDVSDRVSEVCYLPAAVAFGEGDRQPSL